MQNLDWRNFLLSSLENLSSSYLSRLHKASKNSLYSLEESIFKLPGHGTVRERAPSLHLPLVCPPLLYLHTWALCAFLGLSGTLLMGLVTKSFRTWSQFKNQKCCLGTVWSPGRDTAPRGRFPSFLPGDPFGLHMERWLALFGLQFSLIVLCGIWDGFYFTFNQNAVIKSHLENKKK